MCEDKIIDLITEFSDKYLDDNIDLKRIRLWNKVKHQIFPYQSQCVHLIKKY